MGCPSFFGSLTSFFEGFSLAVSNLEMHALFVLGDLRARLVKLFQSRFVYVTEQTAEDTYMAEIDTDAALVVDDETAADLGAGVDLDAGPEPAPLGDEAGQEHPVVLVHPVGQAVVQGGVDTLVQQENLQFGPGRRVAALIGFQGLI